MNFTYKGQSIYQPHPDDSDTIHFLYEWLKDHEKSLGGSAAYEQVLEQYQEDRTEWEMQRTLHLIKEA